MPVNKIFNKFNLSKKALNKGDFETLLVTTLNDYAFSVVWTKSKSCSLSYLTGNTPPSTVWHPIITKSIVDNDGEITVKIGSFAPGKPVKLGFGIQAIDALPRAAVLVTNLTSGAVIKFPAGNAYKNLNKGDMWQETVSINLP